MSEIAKKIVFDYMRNWGQPRERRIGVLNEALAHAGIKCVVQIDEKGTQHFKADDLNEMERAISFRNLLYGCFGISFKNEEISIDALIEKFKKGEQ